MQNKTPEIQLGITKYHLKQLVGLEFDDVITPEWVAANNKPEILRIWRNLNAFGRESVDEIRQLTAPLDRPNIQQQNALNEVLGLLSTLGMGECKQLDYTWKLDDLWSRLNKWLEDMAKDDKKKYRFSAALAVYGIKDGWIDEVKGHDKNSKRLQGVNALLSKVFGVVIKATQRNHIAVRYDLEFKINAEWRGGCYRTCI